jgi:hypothetical protein
LIECHGKVLAIAGKNGGTVRDTLEVYDPGSRSATTTSAVTAVTFKNEEGTPQQVKLSTGRFDFAVSKDGDEVLISGGNDGSSKLNTVEGLRLDSANCRLDDNSVTNRKLPEAKLSGNSAVLSSSRSQLAGFANSTTHVFAAGLTTVASNVVDELDPTFTAGNAYTVSVTRNTTTTPAAAARPTFIPIDGTRFVLWGGNNPGTADALARAQEYSNGTWTSTTIYDDNSTLTARLGATGVFFSGVGKVYAVGGSDDSLVPAVLATMDEANSGL